MATINGTPNNDSLVGTSGDDTIDGQAGSDTIDGAGGNDLLLGGAGFDLFTITGSVDYGHDTISGSEGSDTLFGEAGDDTFELREDSPFGQHPDAAADFIDGGAGEDLVSLGNSVASAVAVDLGAGTLTRLDHSLPAPTATLV